MPTFRYNKLVRDKIARFHIEAGHELDHEYLKDRKLLDALCRKLHEEADEVNGALGLEQLVEEIADVQQIIDDICAVSGIEKMDIENVRSKKEKKKGGFKKGVYIKTVHMPNEDDEWVEYCRRDPKKYLEIEDK